MSPTSGLADLRLVEGQEDRHLDTCSPLSTPHTWASARPSPLCPTAAVTQCPALTPVHPHTVTREKSAYPLGFSLKAFHCELCSQGSQPLGRPRWSCLLLKPQCGPLHAEDGVFLSLLLLPTELARPSIQFGAMESEAKAGSRPARPTPPREGRPLSCPEGPRRPERTRRPSTAGRQHPRAAAPALTAAGWETPSQNHPARLLPMPCPHRHLGRSSC